VGLTAEHGQDEREAEALAQLTDAVLAGRTCVTCGIHKTNDSGLEDA
jgi:hypothetical protein